MKKINIADDALRISISTAFFALLTGCNLAPTYHRPQDVVPATLTQAPQPQRVLLPLAAAQAQHLQWLQNASLRQAVALALQENRDLRMAADNVDKARAQYGIARADLLPGINAQLQQQRSRSSADLAGGPSQVSQQITANVGFASYEVDLWGRIRNLKAAAWQQFLQVEENRRGVEIALIAEVANAWLTLAADQERLALAEQTLQSREQSYALMERMVALGATSGLALAQNRSTVAAARGDVALFTAQLARSRNALQLLLGGAVPAGLLPEPGILQTQVALLQPLPQTLPSSILLTRPDVQAAEHALQARHADIGAARAAFFPSISLTGNVGTGSTQLDGLFTGPNRSWSFIPLIKLPIFSAGRLRFGLEAAQADQRLALAQYEKTVQTAFSEVLDTLADRAQWAARLDAQDEAVSSTQTALTLSQARFDAGADDFLTVLDAQRSLYAAQQMQITLRLAEQQNRITLWKVLGGQVLPAAG